MERRRVIKIDEVKLLLYVLKRIWIPILCGIVGFAGMYWYTMNQAVDMYTARGTMYVYNGNPNLVNYQYTNSSDLNSAVMLIDTYQVVVKSDKVLDVITERLAPDYPGITPKEISGSISMGSVSETGVVEVRCRTRDPQKSADICNAVLDVAPAEIIRVVSAGNIEIIDYAVPPTTPDGFSPRNKALMGGVAGAALAAAVLVLLFLLNGRITDTKDLTDNYTPPILSSVRRRKEDDEDPGAFMLNEKSPMETLESYSKLRMNLLYTLVDKESKSVVVTSAIPGEGKSTIAANLAISIGMSDKKVLLVDSDMRRATQRDIFKYDKKVPGLSDILVGRCAWQDAVMKNVRDGLDILPAGKFPPNPAELLESNVMINLIQDLEKVYDLVLLDMPPINIVSDPLALSVQVGGCLFVTRQNYSDHRDIRKALVAAKMTGMNILGFVFYGEKLSQDSYYSRRYYKSYYHKYDYRKNPAVAAEEANQQDQQEATKIAEDQNGR